MDGGCDWVCDCCGAYMNTQSGFTTLFGTWTCKECGALNDVSEHNVLDLLGMLSKGISTFITKPLKKPDENHGHQ